MADRVVVARVAAKVVDTVDRAVAMAAKAVMVVEKAAMVAIEMAVAQLLHMVSNTDSSSKIIFAQFLLILQYP